MRKPNKNKMAGVNSLFCDNRFLAWESASVKTWEILWLRGSTGSVTGNYLERRQQQTELRSNDIVLIQEHNQNVTRT